MSGHAARQGWDALSPAYRARLERGGITRQTYDAGQPLEAARGHVIGQEMRLRQESAEAARRPFNIVSRGEVVQVTSRYRRTRNLAGAYMTAVGRFLRTGDAGQLARYRGRHVESYPLETDLPALRAAAHVHDIP